MPTWCIWQTPILVADGAKIVQFSRVLCTQNIFICSKFGAFTTTISSDGNTRGGRGVSGTTSLDDQPLSSDGDPPAININAVTPLPQTMLSSPRNTSILKDWSDLDPGPLDGDPFLTDPLGLDQLNPPIPNPDPDAGLPPEPPEPDPNQLMVNPNTQEPNPTPTPTDLGPNMDSATTTNGYESDAGLNPDPGASIVSSDQNLDHHHGPDHELDLDKHKMEQNGRHDDEVLVFGDGKGGFLSITQKDLDFILRNDNVTNTNDDSMSLLPVSTDTGNNAIPPAGNAPSRQNSVDNQELRLPFGNPQPSTSRAPFDNVKVHPPDQDESGISSIPESEDSSLRGQDFEENPCDDAKFKLEKNKNILWISKSII